MSPYLCLQPLCGCFIACWDSSLRKRTVIFHDLGNPFRAEQHIRHTMAVESGTYELARLGRNQTNMRQLVNGILISHDVSISSKMGSTQRK